MTEKKFLSYFRLLDHCAGPGCPVCRLIAEDSRHYLDTLLYEQVTDPDTRRDLRASWGFCNWHAWMLLEIESSQTGTATLYEDLIARVLDEMRRLAPPSRRARLVSWLPFGWRRRRSTLVELYRERLVCPACASAVEAEHRYLATLVGHVKDPDLQLVYARSDGLCVPHALRALELAESRQQAAELLGRTMTKWAKLREDLESFVRKHDYRNTQPYTEAETSACARAFETLAGARGMFGNDIHACDRPRPDGESAGSA